MRLRKWATRCFGARPSGSEPEAMTLDDSVGKRVALAFRGEAASWRTVGGIARAAGLPVSTVQEYLDARKQCFVQASVSFGGKKLYGIRAGVQMRNDGDDAGCGRG